MALCLTPAALLEVGELRRYLEVVKAHDLLEIAHMTSEFKSTIQPVADRYSSRRGSKHWTRRRAKQGPTRKLTDEDARYACRAYFEQEVRVVEIAEKLGVTTSTVYMILHGKSHKRATQGIALSSRPTQPAAE